MRPDPNEVVGITGRAYNKVMEGWAPVLTEDRKPLKDQQKYFLTR